MVNHKCVQILVHLPLRRCSKEPNAEIRRLVEFESNDCFISVASREAMIQTGMICQLEVLHCGQRHRIQDLL
jgi:hypothetical protein